MASVAEIVSDILTKLSLTEMNTSEIKAHTQTTSQHAATIAGETLQIKNRLDDGFAFLGQGLYALLEAQREANAHLATQVDQNSVIICWLAQAADLLCRQLRVLEADLAVHEDVLVALRTLEAVVGLVHARELVEHQRKLELEAKIEQCCPPRPITEPPCAEPCREPNVTTYDPQGQDWDGQWRPGRPIS
jgi:hypothetical protein